MASLSPETLLLQVSLMPRKGVFFDLTVLERRDASRLVPLGGSLPAPASPRMFKSSLPICFAFSSISTRPLKISSDPNLLIIHRHLKKKKHSSYFKDMTKLRFLQMWAQNCVQLYIFAPIYDTRHNWVLKAAAINILYLIVGLKDDGHACSDKDAENDRRVFQLAVLVLRQLPDFETSHRSHRRCFQGFQGESSGNLLHANSLGKQVLSFLRARIPSRVDGGQTRPNQDIRFLWVAQNVTPHQC